MAHFSSNCALSHYSSLVSSLSEKGRHEHQLIVLNVKPSVKKYTALQNDFCKIDPQVSNSRTMTRRYNRAILRIHQQLVVPVQFDDNAITCQARHQHRVAQTLAAHCRKVNDGVNPLRLVGRQIGDVVLARTGIALQFLYEDLL